MPSGPTWLVAAAIHAKFSSSAGRLLLVRRILPRQFDRDLRQRLAVQRHPRRAVGLVDPPPVGSEALRSNTPMLSSPRNPPWKMFRSPASLRLSPPAEVLHQLLEGVLQERPVPWPVVRFSYSYRNSVAHACTGG